VPSSQRSGLRGAILAVATHRLLLGAGAAVAVLVVHERYEPTAPGYGLLLAVVGAGMLGGHLVGQWLAGRSVAGKLLPAAFPAASAPLLVAGFYPSLPVLAGVLGALAFVLRALAVPAGDVIRRASPPRDARSVPAVYKALLGAMPVVGVLVAVPLWVPARDSVLFWGIGFGFALTGLLVARDRRTWPFGTLAKPDPEPDRAVDRHRWRWRGVAMLAAAPLSLAFPEPSWWWLGWVGLLPLFLVVRAAPTVREAGWRAWAGGFGFIVAAQHWLVPNIGPGLLLLAAGLGAVWIPCGWLLRGLLSGRPSATSALAACTLVPAAWLVAEFARSWERLGGPWALLGASQWERLSVLSLASLGGIWLISVVLVATNVALVALWAMRHRPRAVLLLGSAVVGLGASGPAWSALRAPPQEVGNLHVLGAQPGVIHNEQRRFDAGESATLDLVGVGPDLIVWGESSVGFDFADRPDLLSRVAAIASAAGADVLVNTDARRPGVGGIYKATVLVGPDGIRGRYDKIRLVPFGEYIPLRPLLGWVGAIAREVEEDRGRGDGLVLLRTAGVRIGPLVCFELTFPDMSRLLATKGADVIVVQSATWTFQGSWAPEQHSSLAAVRAAETGRPVLHPTLTGVSSAFDATGRKLAWLGTEFRGTYQVDVPLVRGRTPYVILGDWVPAAAFAVLTIAATLAMVRAAARSSEVTGDRR
jgi:apolipoprotein N-acyltransferase